MPRLRTSQLVFFGLVLFALPVLADHAPGHPPPEPGAPDDQYDPFTYQSRRIKDRKTKLQWERGVSAPMSFADATAYCTTPTRLPTLKELLTLVDEVPHLDYEPDEGRNVQKMIDPSAFSDETPVDRAYWTSTRSGTNAFTVDFGDGTTSAASVADLRRARCVQFIP
jgi:hypothetical protein